MLEFIAGTFTVLSSGHKCSLEGGGGADLLRECGAAREERRTRIQTPAFESMATWMNNLDIFILFFFFKRDSIYLAIVSTVLTFL